MVQLVKIIRDYNSQMSLHEVRTPMRHWPQMVLVLSEAVLRRARASRLPVREWQQTVFRAVVVVSALAVRPQGCSKILKSDNLLLTHKVAREVRPSPMFSRFELHDSRLSTMHDRSSTPRFVIPHSGSLSKPSCSWRHALLMPQVNPGSLYRLGPYRSDRVTRD